MIAIIITAMLCITIYASMRYLADTISKAIMEDTLDTLDFGKRKENK